MRNAFLETLLRVAEEDPRVWLVCGDLGFSVLEPFAERFPERYLNAGVAEQNMTGIAAGLALSGKVVFTYSIANFPLFRCLEQIRNDVCYHNLDVKIVSVGGGLSYGSAGYSHHGVEDLAVTRVLPNMAVIAPGDPIETELATRALVDRPGPGYLRLGKAGEQRVHPTPPEFRIGRPLVLRTGSDVTLLSTGAILDNVCTAAERLAARGISAAVLSVHTLSPIDSAPILESAAQTARVVAVEEHGAGGLGSVVAEELLANRVRASLDVLRLRGQPASVAGSQEELRAHHGIDVAGIVRRVEAAVSETAAPL